MIVNISQAYRPPRSVTGVALIDQSFYDSHRNVLTEPLRGIQNRLPEGKRCSTLKIEAVSSPIILQDEINEKTAR
jgi:hypothetical protein